MDQSTKRAIEIFRSWESMLPKQRKKLYRFEPEQVYAIDLCNELASEIKQTGRSALIEELLQKNRPYMQLESWIAIYSVCVAIARGKHPSAVCVENLQYSQHKNKEFLSAVDFWPGTPERDNILQIAPENYLKLGNAYGEAMRAVERTRMKERETLNDEFVRAGDAEIAQQWACAENNRMITNAQATAEQIRQNVEAQAKNMMEKARHDVERIRQESDAEARRIIDAAYAEAARVRAKAEQEREQIIESAKQQGEEEFRARVQAETKPIVQKYLYGYMADREQQFRAASDESRKVHIDLSTQNSAAKKEMLGHTNDIQRQFSATIDRAAADLDNFKAEMYGFFRNWQENLYKRDVQPLVNCYVSLITLLNRMDKDIAGGLAEHLNESEEIALLKKNRISLDKHRRSLERAMSALDLRTVEPQAGDTFDSTFHSAESDIDDEDFDGKQIKRCITPGVTRIDGENYKVYYRAVVEV